MQHLDNIKGVIWDYGGTIDSRGVHWSEVIWDAYLAEGAEVTKSDFRDAYVHAERELARVRHILPEHNFLDLLMIKMRIETDWLVDHGMMSRADADRLAPRIARRCYEEARRCVEEARPVLERIGSRLPMVLVSNFYGNVQAVLADFGLDRYFKAVIESAVVGVRKPDPAIFALGVKALGLPAANVLVIGDSYRKDILPARETGCATAWLKGKGWTADEDAQTDEAEIKSLGEVAEAIF